MEEVETLCAAFAERWPEQVRSFVFGHSAQGRPLRALLVTRSGAFTPGALRERGIPVLLVQAGIHPGESDGKDAGFAALRELLGGHPLTGPAGGSPIETLPPHGDPLEHVAVLFVPAFNADGHERTGRWNRPNQIGPDETGWRATAHNLDLNRDYTKADAPEMRALLALVCDFDPLVAADLHATDGADFEPDVSIQVEPIHLGDPHLHPLGTALRDALILKQDPALAAEFQYRLAGDPAFAADPEARREFFVRRHPSWDTRYAMYPILRTDAVPPLA
ncbi:hypothetical protein GBF35_29720 [Nonomuraea phyllanthi]|nr:hypothetical protein GBF35_29720 [Nonomuraea phyllanthi]